MPNMSCGKHQIAQGKELMPDKLGRMRSWINDYDWQRLLDLITNLPCSMFFGGTETTSKIQMVAIH